MEIKLLKDLDLYPSPHQVHGGHKSAWGRVHVQWVVPLLGAALAATAAALATGIDLPRPEEGGEVPEAVWPEEALLEEEVLRLQLPEDVQKLLLMMDHFAHV